MSSVQEFLAAAALKASADLETAVLRVPEDKRTWSPMGDARTALDMAAECAMLCGSTAELMKSRKWDTNFDFAEYVRLKDELAKDWDVIKTLLTKNVAIAMAAIKAIPDEDLSIEITMPFGTMTLAQIAAYPYWNMSYHEGQINYIASMLGTLK